MNKKLFFLISFKYSEVMETLPQIIFCTTSLSVKFKLDCILLKPVLFSLKLMEYYDLEEKDNVVSTFVFHRISSS